MSEKPVILLFHCKDKNKQPVEEALGSSENIDFRLIRNNDIDKTVSILSKGKISLLILNAAGSGTRGKSIINKIITAAEEVPVIAISGSEKDLSAEKAFEIGFEDYFLIKDLNTSSLLRAIRHSLIKKDNRIAGKNNESLFRDFFDNSPVGFHIFGPDKLIIDINQAELDLIGYEKNEIVGKKKWEDLIIPEHRSRFRKHWKDILNSKTLHDYEYTLVHKEGRHIDVILNASARFDKNNRLINTRGSVIDITEKKLVLKKIEDLARYPDENPSPIIRIDLNGNILYSNRGAKKILKAWQSSGKEKIPENIMDFAKKVFAAHKPEELEIKCGKETCLLMFSPVKRSGYINIYGTFITKLKEIENELLKYKKQLEEKVIGRTKELIHLNKRLKEEIKERKASNLAMMESENKFRRISSSAPDAIAMIDDKSRITFWNKSAENIFGYKREEVINKNFYKLLIPDRYHKNLKDGLKQLHKTGKGPIVNRNHEIMALKKSGIEFPVDISVSSLRIKDRWHAIGIIRDISERKKTETEIKKLATVIEQVDETIVITDLEGTIEYVNPFFEKHTGYSAAEAIGQNPRILKSGKVNPKVYKEMWDTIKSGNIWRGVFINKKKNGSIYDEEVIIFPVKDTDGKMINYAAVKRDITERLEFEEQIKRSNEFLNNIIESLTHPFYVIDAETYEIVLSNKAGTGNKNAVGLKCYEMNFRLTEPCPNLGHQCPTIRIKETGKPVTMEYVYSDENGNPRYIEIYGYPIFDSDGNVVQIIEYTLDITDRKMYEKELVKLSSAVNQSLNIIVITDLNYIIEYVNPKFTEITGFTPEEAIGKSAFILEKRSEADKKEFWEKIRNHGEWQGEFYNKKKNGECYWEFATVTSIKNQEGETVNYLKVGVDITKRKHGEWELEKAKIEAENASRIKSEFLANMSHEIRTPMNSILGFLNLLKNTHLDKKQINYINIITESSNSLLELINDILDLSKIESGKLEVDNIEFDPHKEFEIIYNLFTIKASDKNIELIKFIDPDIPQIIIGDPMRIKQILINLIGNAIKFTDENGFVYIDIKVISSDENSCIINFSVSDTGIGISKDKQKIIFESFSQGDSSVTRKYGGTGLGLAISSNLVKLMGGELKVESGSGKGSRFYFNIKFPIVRKRKPLLIKNRYGPIYILTQGHTARTKPHMDLLIRYVKSFKIETEIITDYSQLDNVPEMSTLFLFLTESEAENINLRLSLHKLSFIIVMKEKDKYLLRTDIYEKIKILYLPVNAWEIINILNDEEPPPYKDDNKFATKKPTYDFKVLVAEDNETNRELIKIMLEERGIEADTADNGLEALQKFKISQYDLILMDMNMPEMNGKDTARKMREFEKKNGRERTPIIAFTAHTLNNIGKDLANFGMDDHITKPVASEKLNAILTEYLINGKNQNKKYGTAESEIKNSITETTKILGIRDEIVEKLIIKFLEKSQEYVSEISAAIADSDFEGIASALHRLKGAVLNLRLDRLIHLTSDMEKEAGRKNINACKKNIKSIVNEINRLKSILK